jgi:hypothetical protein
VSAEIIIALLVGAVQVILAWYGVYVSEKTKRMRHAVIMLTVGAVGIGLTVWATKRSMDSQDALQKQLERILKNTEAPPVINIPPTPQHTHVRWNGPGSVQDHPLLPLHADEEPNLSFQYRNLGDYNLQLKRIGVGVEMVPQKDADNAFARLNSHVPKHEIGGTMVAHTPDDDIRFGTSSGRALTGEDIANFNNGDLLICGVGSVVWADETGQYETHLYRCYHSEKGHVNVVAIKEDNTEHKLSK